MTLATVERYQSSEPSGPRGDAAVVGAGVAGLLTARVLADHYETVTVFERDPLDGDREARTGVPQGRHPHALLSAGRATISDLVGGFGEELVRAGGVVTDFNSDVAFYLGGEPLATGSRRVETVSATRPLIEGVLLERVRDRAKVTVHPDSRLVTYRLDGSAVDGVVVRDGDGERAVDTDLVVDATGRASRTPAWLDAHGYDRPEVDEVTVDLAYSTTYAERPPGDRRTVLVPPAPPRTRGGMAAPVEDGRWVVNLNGVHGDHPPTEHDAFAAFLDPLPAPELAALLADSTFVADVAHYPFPSNRRHRYEDLDRFPEGLVVVGDAVASYNPLYAQGMSVAAFEALVLHHTLAEDDRSGLPLRYFGRVAPVVDTAWLLAVGGDFGFEATTGPAPRGNAVVGRFFDRLVDCAHDDPALADALLAVLTMEEPPSSLFRPGVLWRVLRP